MLKTVAVSLLLAPVLSIRNGSHSKPTNIHATELPETEILKSELTREQELPQTKPDEEKMIEFPEVKTEV